MKNNFNIAESAINLLKDGINNSNKSKIDAAHSMVDHVSFSWQGLEALYLEWEDLVEINKNFPPYFS